MEERKNKKVMLTVLSLLILAGIIYFVINILWNKANIENKEATDTGITTTDISENKYSDINSYIANISKVGSEHKEAISALNTGNYKDALSKWEAINIKSSKSTDLVKKQADAITLAAAYLNYGNAYYKEAEYSKKAIDLLKSVGLSEDNGYYNYYMGYSYEIVKDYEKSMEYYNKALTSSENIYPKSIVYNQLGHLYDLKGDMETAYENYIKAYELDKENPTIMTNIGRVLVRGKEIENAISFFEQALNKTNNIHDKSELLYSLASITLYSQKEGSMEKAFEYANKAIKINPENSNAFMIRGKILYNAGKDNFPEAISSLEESLKFYEYNSSAYEVLGLISMDSEKDTEALIQLNKSIEAIKKDISLMDNQRETKKSKILFFSSLANSKLGNKTEAINNIKAMVKNIDELTILLFDAETKRKDFGRYKNIKNEKEFLELINKK